MPILNWLNKDEAITTSKKCTYRLLEEVPELSYGDADNENLLIQGDNLEALKALIPHYAGKVKCIFIDPPYNTKSAFEHYDDNLEHSKWLSLMYPRLELLRELLAENGCMFVTIDDNEVDYMKVMLDEIFGRRNFITKAIWQKVFSPKNSARHFSVDHDYVLIYAKDSDKWFPNPLPRTEKQNKAYKNPDNDPRGPWMSDNLTARNPYSLGIYPVMTPSGKQIDGPPPGTYWRVSKNKLMEMDADNRIWWGKDGKGVPRQKRFLSEVKDGRVPQTLWFYEEVGHTQEAKKEAVALSSSNVFGTPKPERLIERVIQLGTDKGDIVLDSFLGSGTTAAVAHKMGRKYIGVEIGEHATSLCQPRLKKVVDGEQGGISTEIGWQGGGGFRFYKLGEAVFDEYGCLNTDIKFPALASHIWYLETKTPLGNKADTPLLGVHNDTAYYLLYNGILGDRRPAGGNVLTSKVLNNLPDIDKHERIVIYGESSRLGEARLKQANITFKQIPYDVGTL
ncbi:site-specific DNA-methyltransferase [Vibrio vulnificus]